VEEVTRKKNKVVVIVEWGEDCAIQVWNQDTAGNQQSHRT
jgi:hypothetical protein